VYVGLCPEYVREVTCSIAEGDTVAEGQIIARGKGANAAAIHSPIPGIVEKFVKCPMPDGKPGLAAKIKLTGEFTHLGKPAQKTDWESLTRMHLLRTFAEKGVLNLFSEPVSLADKIAGMKKTNNRILIVRLFDNDTSQKTDSFIARRYQTEIAEGAAILAKAANIEGVALLYDKNGDKPDFEEFSSQIRASEIAFVPVSFRRYFTLTEREMVSEVRRPRAASVFQEAAHTDLFCDPATLFNVYRSVVFSSPVMDTVVHITGSAIKTPGIFFIRHGTLIGDLIEDCGGFIKPCPVFVINGVVTGMSVTALDTPVTKQVKSIRFLDNWEVSGQRAETCIRCGRCKTICPNKLDPAILFASICGMKIADPEYIASAALCENCSLCNTVCPSRLPLSQYISLLKEAVLHETSPV
jgi:electron transport complex protein RnfC